jgi:leucyl/phenylalanyl-tRNA---protein transferase
MRSDSRPMVSEKALLQLQRGRELLRNAYQGVSPRARRLLGFASTRLTSNPFDGLCGVQDGVPLSAAQMILGYSQGLFPMDKAGKLRWHCPDPRFVLQLSELRLSPNMRRDLRKCNFTHTFDREPKAILEGCAERAEGTWLSPRLRELYLELFALGVMHTIETWRDGTLVGGSFGMAIGRIFTGETMFHRAPEAGKSSFAFLAQHLRDRGFTCIDAQDHSDHMARFGAREVPFAEHRQTLALGLIRSAQFREGKVEDGTIVDGTVPLAQAHEVQARGAQALAQAVQQAKPGAKKPAAKQGKGHAAPAPEGQEPAGPALVGRRRDQLPS